MIRGLTIRDGFVGGSGRGGAVAVVEGSLTLADCRVTSSRAFNASGVDGLDSTLRIDRCLIDGNEGAGSGTGVSNIRGVLEINDSTIANNVAGIPDDVQFGTGGGVATAGDTVSPAVTRVNGSTLVANVGEGAANLVNGDNATTIVSHTILGVPADGADCDGTIVSDGYNIDEAGTCGLLDPTDRTGSAGLDFGLADNGGPTPTRALLPGSPAIDGGDPAGCVDGQGAPRGIDQRGSPRPTDGDANGSYKCDIGAFEVLGAPEPGPLGASVAGGLALAWLARRSRRPPWSRAQLRTQGRYCFAMRRSATR